LLGFFEQGRFIYCGRVGTGFSQATLRKLHRQMQGHRVAEPAFDDVTPIADRRGVTWVTPVLVAEVEFLEWTEDGRLRHPSFQGLREDKPAREIGRERAANAPHNATSLRPGKTRRPHSGKDVGRERRQTGEDGTGSVVAGVALTHPDRAVYPEQNITKLDLARFYESIADRILPHIADRPLSLVRCPQGHGQQCFFQKHVTESMPKTIHGVSIQEKDSVESHVVIRDVAGLVSLVQMGVLEIHPWGSRADDPEKPDRLVFDLDPGEGAAWEAVIAAARDVRAVLEEYGLDSFVRTSGGKGLHVVLPIARRHSWDTIKRFSQSIAVELEQAHPDRYVANMSKAKRRGKVFVDYLRNQHGATAVASYSTRARSGAPVAAPLRWNELSPRLAADAFHVRNLLQRLSRLKSDPWDGFVTLRQSLTTSALKRAGVSG
jgi:bifunctional non-homologous end joining protein LigD